MQEILQNALLTQFDFTFDKINESLVLQFGANESLSFENKEVYSILGLKCIKDNSHDDYFQIGYKADKTPNEHQIKFPV